ASLLQDSSPCLLRVIQHKRHKLNKRLFARLALRVGLTHRRSCSNSLPSEQREEVSFEDETEHQQNQEAANPNVHSTYTTAAPAFISTVFQVIASATRRPTHTAPLTCNLRNRL